MDLSARIAAAFGSLGNDLSGSNKSQFWSIRSDDQTFQNGKSIHEYNYSSDEEEESETNLDCAVYLSESESEDEDMVIEEGSKEGRKTKHQGSCRNVWSASSQAQKAFDLEEEEDELDRIATGLAVGGKKIIEEPKPSLNTEVIEGNVFDRLCGSLQSNVDATILSGSTNSNQSSLNYDVSNSFPSSRHYDDTLQPLNDINSLSSSSFNEEFFSLVNSTLLSINEKGKKGVNFGLKDYPTPVIDLHHIERMEETSLDDLPELEDESQVNSIPLKRGCIVGSVKKDESTSKGSKRTRQESAPPHPISRTSNGYDSDKRENIINTDDDNNFALDLMEGINGIELAG
eukprot:CAMPEP_0175055652 /NCGR_PEP_ID=MMETSP0052_2-20121109/10208_1 /TAXON_ID=51329 ORGANISM="Polytomella parva, Strain SAG 63-3" /NCGR_SAMPLE_ID=MMETSP0052_2 /ASSEMBLY_ACC=CAM_ASM_000194 /LENGTH=343 /DNA_ID=CAMNT_0016320539 /DNA_START=27 /DNA_END=1059 /DNA_ORIENTATION=-